jgi:TQO small subunit DoxD
VGPTNVASLASNAVTCVTFDPAMRLPATILQGILARAALSFLRIYLGGVLVLLAWPVIQEGARENSGPALLAWVELLLGTTLVLGLLTRLSAAATLVLALEPVLLGRSSPALTYSAELPWAAIAVALMVGAAGRTFGLDSFLARRWARSPFW